jgi:hypothetical protein
MELAEEDVKKRWNMYEQMAKAPVGASEEPKNGAKEAGKTETKVD